MSTFQSNLFLIIKLLRGGFDSIESEVGMGYMSPLLLEYMNGTSRNSRHGEAQQSRTFTNSKLIVFVRHSSCFWWAIDHDHNKPSRVLFIAVSLQYTDRKFEWGVAQSGASLALMGLLVAVFPKVTGVHDS